MSNNVAICDNKQLFPDFYKPVWNFVSHRAPAQI